MEFRYYGVRKLKIKFERKEAGDTFTETLKAMQEEVKTRKTISEHLQKYKSLTEVMLRDYNIHFSNKETVFRVHKK